MFSWKLDLLSR